MSETAGLLRTPLYELHVAAGAKMVEFAGWMMPVEYAGILTEHRTVREAAGAFDLSHMGRLYLSGPDAGCFLQLVATNDVLRLETGQVQYSPLCNQRGGVRDDVLISRLGETEYLVVANASNRVKILSRMERLRTRLAGRRGPGDLAIEDRTFETVMIGVQGPRSAAVLQPLVDIPLDGLKYYHVAATAVLGTRGLVSRTGYTGEDGFEVVLAVDGGVRLWQRIMQEAARDGVALAGLGARDTLRLEAGMPLYGHELSETINPFEVGLERFVRLEKGDFVGREALRRVAESGPSRRLVGLEVLDRAIARQRAAVVSQGDEIGRVTSGSYSPTLDRSIAMALVRSDVARLRPPVGVVVRGSLHPAEIVDLPFFHRRRRKGGEQR